MFLPFRKACFSMFSASISGTICALILNEFRHWFRNEFGWILACIFNGFRHLISINSLMIFWMCFAKMGTKTDTVFPQNLSGTWIDPGCHFWSIFAIFGDPFWRLFGAFFWFFFDTFFSCAYFSKVLTPSAHNSSRTHIWAYLDVLAYIWALGPSAYISPIWAYLLASGLSGHIWGFL